MISDEEAQKILEEAYKSTGQFTMAAAIAAIKSAASQAEEAERKAVFEWLRELRNRTPAQGWREALANFIERGDHLESREHLIGGGGSD